MKKWKQLVALTLVVSGSIASGMALADSLEKANQKDLAMLLHAANGMNSAYSASVIGETRDRVYIEYQTGIHIGSVFSPGPKHIVYWVPRSEITEEQLRQFRTLKENSRVWEAFRRGMTQSEAAAAVKSLGLERRNVANRPASGWVERDGTPQNIQGHARNVEQTHKENALLAEWYPDARGPAGTCTLYLFYGSDGKLIEYYCYTV